MSWVVMAAFWLFIFWRVRRAREKAAEISASGELRSPLYWIGVALALGVLALSMVMASMRPGTIGPVWWLLAGALFVATLGIRRALLWRFPH